VTVFAAACLLVAACGASGGVAHDGGAGGGATSSGGKTGSGGAQGTGSGGSASGSGGMTSGATGGSSSGGSVGGSGSGGSTASGGAAGNAPDGGVANPAMPTKISNGYHFAFGDVVFDVDAQTGGRVSRLSLAGTDIIVPTATDPTTWGSVFWTSPRSDWTPQTWPPPIAIDNGPYTGAISGAHVVLNGQTDTSIGVSMSKDYAADATTGWITTGYTINATKAIKAAPWEVSRVPRGGMAFFPVGSTINRGPLTITQTAGIVWFDDASKSATSPDGSKLAADGMGGWTAYLLGGNLFLKKFMDVPANQQAPGEGEVGVYPGAGFLEFEVQGPYTSIPASGKLPWSMSWTVVKVPSSVTIAVGSSSLVNFARQTLGL
jgi:hypothetical protein